MSLKGKRALVTGASRGIGAAIAKKLAADGADVAITYDKSGDRAAEVARAITVNLVHPGSIDTDMNPANGPASDMLRSFIALGQYGVAEDIGNAVAFLTSSRAQYITGTALTVDGGANA